MPVPVFSCFLFQKSYKGNILGIGRNLMEFHILPEDSRSQKGKSRGATGGPHPAQARVTPWPRLGQVWPTWHTSGSALPPIYSPRRENPRYSAKIPERSPQPPPSSRGDQKLFAAPCRRGESSPEAFFITMLTSGVMCE